MANLQLKGFKVTSGPDIVAIEDQSGEKLEFLPADGVKAIALLKVAVAMEGLEALPQKIKNPPFKLYFTPDDTLELRREDQEGKLALTWDSADDLIVAIGEAMNVIKNDRQLSPRPRRSFNPTQGPE